MTKRLLFAIHLTCSILLASAQQGWKFHPTAFAGFSQGDLGAYGLFKINLALTHGPWSVGPGVGLDYYRYRTTPVFLSITRDITSAQQPAVFFLFGEGGIDIPWYYQDTHPYDYYAYTYHSDAWYGFGPGLRFRLSHRHPQDILVTAGYTNKNVKETQTARHPCTNPNYCYLPDLTTSRYFNHLLTFCIGLRF